MFNTKKELNFKEQSESALHIFRATLESLNNVNLKILQRDKELTAEIISRENERDEINDIAMENGNIINKINQILN